MKNQNEQDRLEFELCQYLDGQLGWLARRRLEKRLAQDGNLRLELQKYASLDEHLASLGDAEIDGLDYSVQREDILASLERRNLLSQRRRIVVLRPVFMGGFAAVAASVAVAFGIWFMVKAKAPVVANQSVVEVALAPPARSPAGESQVEMVCQRMDLGEIRLAPPEDLLSPDLPRGTVLVAAGRPSGRQLTQAAIPFPEMR